MTELNRNFLVEKYGKDELENIKEIDLNGKS
jgi:hypothetical protein